MKCLDISSYDNVTEETQKIMMTTLCVLLQNFCNVFNAYLVEITTAGENQFVLSYLQDNNGRYISEIKHKNLNYNNVHLLSFVFCIYVLKANITSNIQLETAAIFVFFHTFI